MHTGNLGIQALEVEKGDLVEVRNPVWAIEIPGQCELPWEICLQKNKNNNNKKPTNNNNPLKVCSILPPWQTHHQDEPGAGLKFRILTILQILSYIDWSFAAFLLCGLCLLSLWQGLCVHTGGSQLGALTIAFTTLLPQNSSSSSPQGCALVWLASRKTGLGRRPWRPQVWLRPLGHVVPRSVTPRV